MLGLQKVQAKINDCDSVIILGSGGAAQSVFRSIALAKTHQALMAIIHRMSKEDLLVDLIYDQSSELYRIATRIGLPAQDGLAMMIEQARLSEKLW